MPFYFKSFSKAVLIFTESVSRKRKKKKRKTLGCLNDKETLKTMDQKYINNSRNGLSKNKQKLCGLTLLFNIKSSERHCFFIFYAPCKSHKEWYISNGSHSHSIATLGRPILVLFF